ncbi:hypothetical protein [Candidatus Reidiella endopervernicosa]|uniref:Alpha-(1,6)-fucosyltransferase N- and catalytic domain-containing protein n=1 Tax=Candidatus Reidiella endopervernicosa TaxID=2738883 RepID=A0A6N0HRT9_9GAMM|nr:hypothetical protein [Candidatus Reidiella endopervernicosa]QKQ24998.1 hypothetical protein HUE57_00875 [Candidatus Reidiella endopervernicosa]
MKGGSEIQEDCEQGLFEIRINHANAGFFAYVTFVINQLLHCEREGYTPVVHFGSWSENGSNAYYDPEYGENTWDYYFEPVAGVTYEDVERRLVDPDDSLQGGDLHRLTNSELWHLHAGDERSVFAYPYGVFKDKVELDEAWYRDNRERAHAVIQKYIHLKPHLVELLESFVERLFAGHKVLGIHMRGTDKGTADSATQLMKIIPPKQYFPYIDRYVLENPECKIFVATDQVQYLDEMRTRYGDRVLSLDVSRSRRSINAFQQRKQGSGYIKGEEVLLDCLLLSRCDFLLKCCSAVGEFAIYFNPELPCIDLNHEMMGVSFVDKIRHYWAQQRYKILRKWDKWHRKHGRVSFLSYRKSKTE